MKEKLASNTKARIKTNTHQLPNVLFEPLPIVVDFCLPRYHVVSRLAVDAMKDKLASNTKLRK
jgi:hypothetical protein